MILDSSCNRAADTAHDPLTQSSSASGSVSTATPRTNEPTKPAAAVLETPAWCLNLRRTAERSGLLPHAITRIGVVISGRGELPRQRGDGGRRVGSAEQCARSRKLREVGRWYIMD